MSIHHSLRLTAACAAAILATATPIHAQFTTPNVISTAGAVSTTLGNTLFINHGLQGVGRISGSLIDDIGDTFGSVSGLAVTNWAKGAGDSYTGIFNTLPDRGYNVTGVFTADYASRIQQFSFTFTPYTSGTNIGGTTIEEKIAAQSQIVATYLGSQRFTYDNPTSTFTTGLDPQANSVTLFGKNVPFVTIDGGNTINKLPLDAEALVILPDGSGYIGDEYGANIYHFDANKKIDGVIVGPDAVRPHIAGILNYTSLATPADGRRNNQGFEGVGVTPDGKKLIALLQSATVQDTNGAAQQTRNNTRLFVYDLTGGATPDNPSAEYVIQLPTYRSNGDGGAVDRTAAQSEIIVIDDHRILVLSRDSNGLGVNPGLGVNGVQSMYKSILLVDLSVGNPTDIVNDAARNATGGKITGTGGAAAGVLDPSITPLTWAEAVNLLNVTQLAKFNVALDAGGTNQVTKLTLSEKWEGLALVPALDPLHPDDYFLFVANDNDFLTSQGFMNGASYNGFNGYSDYRIPAPVGGSTVSENDTFFLAYRVTITTVPEPGSAALFGFGAAAIGLRRRR